jgi:prolyl-tRNA synthetase
MTTEPRGGSFVLGPTHEEVVTVTVGAEVDSYRQLPLCVYQVQVKFRDEARPRFGLLRTRELIMADAYSFDIDKAAMQGSYRRVFDAYLRIFDRLDLPVTPVEAESGAIGGDVNHEFMVPSPIGEDFFVSCPACGYAANVEAATRSVTDGSAPPATTADGPMIDHHTPDRPGIDDVVAVFADSGATASDFLKSMAVFDDQGRPTLVLVPGDREARLPSGWRLFTDEDFAAHPSLPKGYLGPVGAQEKGIRVVGDVEVRERGPWIIGAGRVDHHASGAQLDRDFTVDDWGSFAQVVTGDPCGVCGQPVELVRSIEAAHTFQLGKTYSLTMPGAGFVTDADGEDLFMMGCYGMGVSRLLAVLAEVHHDDSGLVWPRTVAPYQFHLLALGAGRSAEVAEAADRLYEQLTAAGAEVLYDDRDVSPGVKFADADLLGLPVRLVVGAKGLARGVVEWRSRASGEEGETAIDGPIEELTGV